MDGTKECINKSAPNGALLCSDPEDVFKNKSAQDISHNNYCKGHNYVPKSFTPEALIRCKNFSIIRTRLTNVAMKILNVPDTEFWKSPRLLFLFRCKFCAVTHDSAFF